MPSGRLSHDEFFERLTILYNGRRDRHHGTIFLSQKRLSPEKQESKTAVDDLSDLEPLVEPLPILIRASNNNVSEKTRKINKDAEKIKLSTEVLPQDFEAFYVRYAECCKVGMSALKKRDKKKSKAAAKRKKGKTAGSAAE